MAAEPRCEGRNETSSYQETALIHFSSGQVPEIMLTMKSIGMKQVSDEHLPSQECFVNMKEKANELGDGWLLC